MKGADKFFMISLWSFWRQIEEFLLVLKIGLCEHTTNDLSTFSPQKWAVWTSASKNRMCERALILLTWYTYPGIPSDTCSHSIQSVDELWSDDLDKMLTIRYEVGNAVKPDSVLMYNNVDPLQFMTVIFSAIQVIIHTPRVQHFNIGKGRRKEHRHFETNQSRCCGRTDFILILTLYSSEKC